MSNTPALATSSTPSLASESFPQHQEPLGKAGKLHAITLGHLQSLASPDLAASAASIGWSFTARTHDSGNRPTGNAVGDLVWPTYEARVGKYAVSIRDLVSAGLTAPFTGGTITYISDEGRTLSCKFTPGTPDVLLDGKSMYPGTTPAVKTELAKKLLVLADDFLHHAVIETRERAQQRLEQPIVTAIQNF